MRFLTLVLLYGLMIYCNSNSEPVQVANVSDSLNIKDEKPELTAEFPEYYYHSKDTLIETIEHGIQTQTIELGSYKTDSIIYFVAREIRIIPGIEEDSPSARSTLFLKSENNDPLIFDAEIPERLPIDIYQNHFVFRDENGQFKFAKIDVLKEDILCFSGSHNGCFI